MQTNDSHCVDPGPPAQEMHQRFQEHWGLEQVPFPSGNDPRLFYQGASQNEALARLRFLIANARRCGLLLAEPGLGKSMLQAVFAEHAQRQGFAVAQVDLTAITAREFYGQLGEKLSAGVKREDSLPEAFCRLADQLQVNRWQGTPTLLLLDDVAQAGPDLLAQLVRLSRIDPSSDSRLTLVLATDSAGVSRLSEPLLDLVDLRIDLEPWDEADTIGYLQHALVEAGANRPLFNDGALAEIDRLAAGVPRQVNRLADQALLAGYRGGVDTIGADAVQQAAVAINFPVGA